MDMVRVEYRIQTSKIGSMCSDVVEFPRSEWDSMTDEQKEQEMQECAFNEMDWGFTVIDEEG